MTVAQWLGLLLLGTVVLGCKSQSAGDRPAAPPAPAAIVTASDAGQPSVGPESLEAIADGLRALDPGVRASTIARLEERIANSSEADRISWLPLFDVLMSLSGYGGIGRENSRSAQELLSRMGKPALPKLMASLGSPDGRERRVAIEVLSGMDLSPAVLTDAIAPLVFDSDVYARQEAIQQLGRLGPHGRGASAALERCASQAERSVDRLCCHLALAKMGEADIHIKAAASYLADDDDDVRAGAASRLADFGPAARGAWAALLGSLKDPSAQVRINAAATLGEIHADRP